VAYIILQEICKNVDGYRLSTFLSKDRDSKDGRIHAGPVWDFNLAFGNANYYDGWDTDDWEVDVLEAETQWDFQVPFWWYKLAHERVFAGWIRARWQELRAGVLATGALNAYIDSIADTLNEAQQRNFEIWPGPGEPGTGFWPVPDIFYTFSEYQDEIDYLKSWISERVAWMDANIGGLVHVRERPSAKIPEAPVLRQNYPNPFNGVTVIEYVLPVASTVLLTIHDAAGRTVRTLRLGAEPAGMQSLVWDGKTDDGSLVPSGLYVCQLTAGKESLRRKIVLLK
jgi:hypothetical protein